jgi:hypothetical protein
VPVAAAIEVILGRLQDREVPVAQDLGGVETVDLPNDETEETLPDDQRGSGTGDNLPKAPIKRPKPA